MNLFALLGQTGEIRRVLELWNKNKADNTEMIDRGRAVMAAIGVLEAQPADGNPVPVALRKYNTEWIQESLNAVDNAGLTVDGQLGGDNSRTRQAVRKFQNAHGLKVDGFPGVQTVAVLAAERDKKEA